MILELINKEDKEYRYCFKANERNIVILDGWLYDLTDEEAKKFYNGDYMREYLKEVEEGLAIGEFDLGMYIIDAPLPLEEFSLNIK